MYLLSIYNFAVCVRFMFSLTDTYNEVTPKGRAPNSIEFSLLNK